jgi:UDP-N-acetylmuramate dehydrogenase
VSAAAPGWLTELEARLADVRRDAPIREFTTYRLGGPARALVRARCLGDLRIVAEAVARWRPPVLVVGRGSNLLVADEGFDGIVVVLEADLAGVEVGERRVRAGGGAPLGVVARRASVAGRAGLEFYVGIPGTVGGAVRMNAGGHGRDTREVLIRAEILDLTDPAGVVRSRTPASLGLGYRTSTVRAAEVVTAAELAVTPDAPDACAARLESIVRWRREHQPGGANAGSVFRNPPGDAAGRIIEACGLKGFRVGGAAVSEKHANFFQADPGATARDVYELVARIREIVEARTGVRLEPELCFVGFRTCRRT